MKGKGNNPATSSQNAVYRKVIGGMMGGLCEALCLHPLDTVKTRLQLSGTTTKASKAAGGAVKYKGVMDCASTIIRSEGPLSLYKGLTPFSVHLVSKYFLRYGVNFQLRALICSGEDTTFVQNIIAGMTAGTVEALVIVTPFEVVKTRLQAQQNTVQLGATNAKAELKYKGPIHAVGRILRKEGIGGLWKGVEMTVFRQATNQASMFTAYTWLRVNLWNNPDNMKPWQAGITGLIAACVGPLFNGPADVIKTRMMNQTHSMIDPEDRYKSTADAFKRILRAEGPRGLYKGLAPRLARVAPGQAITWMAVEQFNSVCNQRNWLV